MVVCLVAAIAEYRFAIDKKLLYDMTVELDGTLPILGGREGKAKLTIGFSVAGLEPDAKGNPRAIHELTSFRAVLNEAVMPFTLENVRSFFPKTTISYLPSGQVLASDAPDKEIAAALPGLDVKRFPEMSYLPLEFPANGNSEWEFQRLFAGATMAFKGKLLGAEDSVATYGVEAKQRTTTWEDAANKAIKSAQGAAYEVRTAIDATGTIMMDRIQKSLFWSKVVVTTESDVKGIVNDFHGKRRLKTTIEVSLRTPAKPAP